MPWGIITVSLSVLLGGLFGAYAGKLVPDKIKSTLPMALSLSAFAMGLSGMFKMQSLPPIVLSLIGGTIIGSLLGLERLLKHWGEKTAKIFIKNTNADPALKKRQLESLSIAVILFCAGPTGIYGSMIASIANDNSILFSKSFLDFCTASLFAINTGFIISLLSIPMFVIFIVVYLLAGSIAPLCTPAMFADFSGLGGLLILATAFRMAEIKIFHVTDMLPAMLLILPLSHLWSLLPL